MSSRSGPLFSPLSLLPSSPVSLSASPPLLPSSLSLSTPSLSTPPPLLLPLLLLPLLFLLLLLLLLFLLLLFLPLPLPLCLSLFLCLSLSLCLLVLVVDLRVFVEYGILAIVLPLGDLEIQVLTQIDALVLGAQLIILLLLQSLLGVSPLLLVPQLAHTLAEVDMDSPVINETVVHFEVGLFTGSDCHELDEAIAERASRLPVPDDLATLDLSEATEYGLQVLVSGDRVEFADEQHIVGRLDVRVRQVIEHLQHDLLTLQLVFSGLFQELLLAQRLFLHVLTGVLQSRVFHVRVVRRLLRIL